MITQEVYKCLPTNLTNNAQSKINVAIAIVKTLELLGIKQAFGIPGGAFGSLFNALSKAETIKTTLCQHEGGAAYMALGRTLVTKDKSEMGLCFATAGPGITNLITGVAAAYEEGVPIFVLTGNISTDLTDRGATHDSFSSGIDAVKMLEPITWRSVTVRQTEEIIPTVIELYNGALQSRQPVHLNVPINLANTEFSHEFLPSSYFMFEGIDSSDVTRSNLEQIKTACRSFLQSKRPLIFAGNGFKTSGLQGELRDLIEAIAVPIITTSHGKGVFPEEHPYCFGNFGFAAHERGRDFLTNFQPTAILFLGTRLGEESSLGWSPLLYAPKLKIHVDRDPKQLNKVIPVEFPIQADLGEFTAIMIQTWKEIDKKPSQRIALMEAHRKIFLKKEKKSKHEVCQSDITHPRFFIQLLDLYLPDDIILFSDIGSSMAWAINNLTIKAGQEFYVPLGLASMGSGICGAIGAKSAHPHRPVVCLTGDGSTLMHGTELFTAVNSGIGIKLIVLNDGGHGIIEHGQKICGYENDIDVRFKQPVDFKKFASALGVESYQAKTIIEFMSLPLDRIFSSEEPVLIDITIDREAVPPISSRTRVLGMSDRS